jgi:hypothetical protein
MGRRDVFFWMLIGGGTFVLGAGLLSSSQSKTPTRFDAGAYHAPDFVAVVRRVDASFRHSWTEGQIAVAPRADDLLVARRLALGLMGTIPSLEDIRQFESLPQEQRLSWWIDHILHDRRFADNFAERFARAFVGIEDGPFIFYRRRRFVAWLAEQFAANRPYDRLVRDLIASEGLWTDKPAVNFISVTVQPDNKNQPDPVRLAGRTARTFLGLRLDCAQCHNHPYAEWKQSNFQELSAFFGQTHLGFTGIYDGPGEYRVKERGSEEMHEVAPRVPFAAELLPEHGSRRQRLAHWITDAKNPYFSRAAVNRVWAILFGRPLVEPVDNLETDGPMPPVLDLLADDFAANGFDVQRLIRIIASTEVFRLDSAADHPIGETEEKAWAVFPLSRLRPDQVAGGIQQAASVAALDAETHILFRLIRYGQRNDFVKRYGDTGEDEFDGHGGTIPQRLLMMNGELLHEKIKESPFNAGRQISWMAADDAQAVEAAYLTALTRRPTSEESQYFQRFLAESNHSRAQCFEDIFWTLLNATEFSWNH